MKTARYTVASTVALLCAVAQAHAASSENLRLAFDIHANRMEEALTEFARTTDLQVLFQSALVQGQQAPVVSGDLSPERALQALLANSGLRYEFINARTVAIRPAFLTDGEPLGPVHAIRVADAGDQEPAAGEYKQSGDRADSDSTAARLGVPEVLVRGSRVLNVDKIRSADDIQPYVVFRREDIERSGAQNVQDFLSRRLTSTTTFVASGQSPNSTAGNTSSINLRGLGANQTLILVDGHRVASYAVSGAPSQADLNGIPLAAIERIEILPTTAAGIYGGGATGGVVNVVLKRDFRGVDVRSTYEDSFQGGGAARRFDLAAGFDLEGGRTHVLFGGSYSLSNGMLAGDRDFSKDARALTLANAPASFGPTVAPPLGATTNIRSTTVNLTLKGSNTPLNSRITSVPIGYAGPQSDGGQAFLSRAGQYNLDLPDSSQTGGRQQSLLNAPEVRSFTATVNREFTDRVKSYLTLSTSKNENQLQSVPGSAVISLLANSPANPFNQPIQVVLPALNTADNRTTTLKSQGAVGGVVVDLGKDWSSSVDYTWTRTRFSWYLESGYNVTAAQTAARAGTLGVFADVNQFPVDLRPYDALVTQTLEPVDTTMRTVALRVGGPLFQLPAGPVSLSLLGEHRHEQFDTFVSATGTSYTVTPTQTQAADSVYMEVAVPVVSAAQGIPAVHALDLQLAARHDSYRTFGANSYFPLDVSDSTDALAARNSMSSTDPTVGLAWKPTTDAVFRASYGTGFLPPAVNQLVPGAPSPTSAATFQVLNLRDPLRGNEVLGTRGDVTLLSGGNENLLPEDSKSTSIGVVLTPRFLSGLRASVDWVRIRKTNEIASLGLQQVYISAGDKVPGYVTRGPVPAGDPYGVGPITTINSSLTNVTDTEVKAYDFALEYRYETAGFGNFGFSSAATRNMSFRRRATAASDELDNAGLVNVLKWRANATLSWDWRDWSVAWNSRFYDSYWLNLGHTVNATQGSATIPSQIYHDLFVTRRFQQPMPALNGLELQVGVKNVFDKKPPLDLTSAAQGVYYSTLGDPRLASYYLSLKATF